MRWLAVLLVACGGSPVPPATTAPARAAPRIRAVQIAAAELVTCARLDTGRVRCWGKLGNAVSASPTELPFEHAAYVAVTEGAIHAVDEGGALSGIAMFAGAPLGGPTPIATDVGAIRSSRTGLVAQHRDGGMFAVEETRSANPFAVVPLYRLRDTVDFIARPYSRYCAIDRSGRLGCATRPAVANPLLVRTTKLSAPLPRPASERSR